MRHSESTRLTRPGPGVRHLAAVGVALLALLIPGPVAAADEQVTGAELTSSVAGPALQVFGLPLAAALWLLAGVLAATVGLVASRRRPRPVRSALAAASVTPVDGARA